jgi:curved DNA-binding protein CbpA
MSDNKMPNQANNSQPSGKLEGNHYEILGVEKNASKEVIKKAYHTKALKYHPDKHNEPDGEKFIQITEAYDTLSDSGKKQEYDFELNSTTPGNTDESGNNTTQEDFSDSEEETTFSTTQEDFPDSEEDTKFSTTKEYYEKHNQEYMYSDDENGNPYAAKTANAVAVVAYVPSAAPTPKPTSNTTPGNNPTPMTPIGNSAPTRNKDDVNTDDVNKDDANKDAKKDDANKDIANNSKPADERNTMIDPDYKDPYYNMLVKSIEDFRKMFGDSNLRKGLTDPAGSAKAASKFGWNVLSNTYSSVKNKAEEIKKNYSNAAQAIGNGFTYLANKEVPNKNDKADTSTEDNSDTDKVRMNSPSKQ